MVLAWETHTGADHLPQTRRCCYLHGEPVSHLHVMGMWAWGTEETKKPPVAPGASVASGLLSLRHHEDLPMGREEGPCWGCLFQKINMSQKSLREESK